jgi:phosphotransferase system enzyme I (PtsP)
VSDFRKDEVALMCDVGELIGLFDTAQGMDAFLAQAVSKVAWHMRAALCSIYLYDPGTGELVLRANQGLEGGQVGRLRLRLGESLAGWVAKEGKAVREARAEDNPHWRKIAGLGEERYVAFLGVPIMRYMRLVGVIVVQDPQWNYFTEHDERALKVIAAQLAGVIESAGLFMKLKGGAEEAGDAGAGDGEEGFGPGSHEIAGQGASGGMAVGLSMRLGHYLTAEESIPKPQRKLTAADFERAVEETGRQLLDLQGQLEEKLHDAASMIFGAHVLMLRDEAFSGEIRDRMKAGEDPWEATVEEIRRYTGVFEASPVEELREKVLDVQDMGHRLLANLANLGEGAAVPDYRGRILIATELLPSDILKLSAEGAAGLVLLSGGQYSHVAILSKALRLPLVISDDARLQHVPEGTVMVMNGATGMVVVRPGEEAEAAAREMVKGLGERLGLTAKAETRTKDGVRVHLRANLNLSSELEAAGQVQAEGVGLYRTEFPFIVRSTFPTEEEQYRFYCAALQRMGEKPVVFRTLDVGGDKALSYFPVHRELNPSLGLRALRFSFRNPDIFRQQLRALLRAAAGHPGAKIMFPMVGSLDEFTAARNLAYECERDLEAAGLEARIPEMGVMVELPSAVWIADELAAEADFLSIGSNDLVQYLLAADRTNEAVADWYAPQHPAVLRSLARIVEAADRAGKPVSLCGDLATDTTMMPFLVGIGLRQFSMDPTAIPAVQRRIEGIDSELARRQAERMLGMGRLDEVQAYLRETRQGEQEERT